MKKLLLIISTMYLTGCSVAKPVVLSAPLQQINRAYDSNNTRNGATDIEFVNLWYGLKSHSASEYVDYTIELYITPYNNPTYFSFSDDNTSTREEGNYRSFDTNIFFQTKASIRVNYFVNNVLNYRYENSTTMEINTSQASKNTKAFKMYKLPYNIASYVNMPNDSFIRSYVYNNTLESSLTGANSNIIKINPYQYTYNVYTNQISNGQMYYYYQSTENVADYLPPLEDPNANRLGLYYYYDLETVGAMNINWLYDINDDNILSGYYADIKPDILNFFDLTDDVNDRGYLDYQYNASLSDELSAYQTGYNQGITEGTEGVGVGWVRQVFRAIQAFLDFDFGFFKLGHLLGGILVIAIVIFVVRWFR